MHERDHVKINEIIRQRIGIVVEMNKKYRTRNLNSVDTYNECRMIKWPQRMLEWTSQKKSER